MRESPAEVATGALVLLVGAGFIWWGADRVSAGTDGDYAVTASFRSVEGIGPGTDVRMAGVKIGRVSGLDLDPQSFRAVAELSLDSGVPLPTDSSAVISSDGLLGGAFVEIFPGGELENLAEGGQIYDTQGAVSLLQLLITYIGGGSEEAP
ncbi:outer membrane lipid asymmetry maintenance protein MlaD [Pseudoroseicyclus tamaricis]|uniref:Outer membrane lipid asymmetry maintenance protein MlaD n=1 Tax=Pseudoroseicyclus tamaricis TaxID=2705421 RepID=A0A6B2K352_9RHOB|nr:outer membrane lipid asymmetry maintenance protein MlaD [Pseudoroseicyclus tamaricis]NDV00936.1 outer membrane lipid asymmetry maintenance protein MlaD [Pseudoroseicyclus tamaricis]